MINRKLLFKVLPILAFSLSPILNLIALPFITEKISPEQYGIYNYYVALINMVIMISFLPSINSSILRFLNIEFEDFLVDRSTIFKFSAISIIIYVIFSGILFAFYQDVLIIYLSVVYLFIYLVNYFKSYYNVNGYKIKFSFLLLAVTLSQFLLLFFFYYFSELSVYHILMGNFIFSLLFLTYSVFKSRKKILPIVGSLEISASNHKASKNKILKFVIPSLAIAFAGLILATGDRIIIKNLLSDGELYVGIYSVNYVLYAQVIDLIVAVFYLYIPYFLYSIYENRGELLYLKNLKYIFEIYVLVSTFIVVVLLFNYDKINFLFFNENYLIQDKFSIYILVGQYFFGLYRVISNYFLVTNRQKITSYILIFTAVLNIILNILFIPIYGYIAAAVTTLISFIILFALIYLSVYNATRFNLISPYTLLIIISPVLILVLLDNPKVNFSYSEILPSVIFNTSIVTLIFIIFCLPKIYILFKHYKEFKGRAKK